MTRDEMIAVAKQELAHIPKGDYTEGLLRSAYWIMRLHSLGKKAKSSDDPQQLVEGAAEDVRRLAPTASLDYDHNFFGGKR